MRRFYESESFFNSKSSGEALVGYRDYDAEENVRRRTARSRLQEIESLFPPNEKLKLLKIACGYGTLVKLARDRGHMAEGIDISEAMVKKAREVNGLNLIQANFLDHDFGSQKYDVILLYGAINNFLKPLEVAEKIFGLLKPGGFYITNHMWLNSAPEKIQGKSYWIYRPPIVAIFPRKEFKRRHEALGFEVEKTKSDTQYHSLDQIFGFIQIRSLIKLVELLRIGRFGLTMPTPGYEKVFFKKQGPV